MDINIRQYASNQGVSVHVNGKKNVTINEINENGVTPLLAPRRKGALPWMASKLKNKKFRSYSAVVSVFLIVGSISFLLLNREPLEDRLYEKYYKPMKADSFIMVDNTEFSEAQSRYNNDDPVAAWIIMKNLPINALQKELTLYKALTLMELERYQEAIQYFDVLAEMSNNKVIMVRTKWYQGLCYLKIGNILAAKDAFSFVSPLYKKEYKKAQRILSRLEKHKTTVNLN